MIEFNTDDLYPLLAFEDYTYQEAKEHALLVDDHLGFDCESVEATLRHGIKNATPDQQNWENLPLQAMQTPYVELRGILDLLKPQPTEKLIDLGAAYGRLGFVTEEHYPEVQFIGFELEGARVAESLRVMKLQGMTRAQFEVADLASPEFELPVADYYFLFDYGHENDVRKTLEDLRRIARYNPIQVVARGRLSRTLIHSDHPWLASVYQPMHFPHFSIYRS